jgi:hypothetical protein
MLVWSFGTVYIIYNGRQRNFVASKAEFQWFGVV